MADIIDKHPSDLIVKAAALYASQYVVSIVTHNVTGRMAKVGYGRVRNDTRTFVIRGTGVIIECNFGKDEHEGTYLCTILTPASLFLRTNGVPFQDIQYHLITLVPVIMDENEFCEGKLIIGVGQVDVFESGGKLFKGEVLACDFHYNLAAIRILSESPMPTAIFRGLDDMSSIDVPEHCQLCVEKPFQLLSHSSLFKILPETSLIYVLRDSTPPCDIEVFSGVMGMSSPFPFGCKELLWIRGLDYYDNGGPIFNCFGEVIGISCKSFCFLPSNLVSRWWNHYKSCREFIRPWLGVEVSNHHEVERFVKEFPNITGVVITKVEKKTSAYYSDLQPNDVIITCDGKVVRNKLKFFEIIWDNVGKAVELNVLRPNNGRLWNASITIGKRTPDNLYRWLLPKATVFRAIDDGNRGFVKLSMNTS